MAGIQHKNCALTILFAASLLTISESIIINVPYYKEGKCICDEYSAGTLIYGNYELKTDSGKQLDVEMKILDPSLKVVHTNLHSGWNSGTNQQGTFSITARTGGDYNFCFLNRDTTSLVKATMKTFSTNEQGQINGPTPNLGKAESSLSESQKLASTVKKEFAQMKDREADHRDTNEEINSRVNLLSILSVLILVSSTAFQMIYLKKYFTSKKLI
eukprot:TRINITY_DN8617_c0_g1_i1.p1 TRINITY_DN8617_c0_g1~~TRINITY_DN8617_c0_g1_i1.p1  ORF type:complete len:244 (-),score=36.73 TRINITY_DN8617_c0_g1_i1:25-669(-)